LTAASWQALHFTAPQLAQAQISGLSADPDLDRLPNLLEFAFARSPLEAETEAPFTMATEIIEVAGVPQRYLTLTFDRPANSQLQYVLQKSTDLRDWKTRPLVRVRASVNPETQIETITVREKQPMSLGQASPDGRTQMRIRIAQ
jgi:hypothetical protein